MTAAPRAMPFDELELAYEALAEAIDRAGPRNETLFLTKLALALGQHLGSAEPFRQAIAIALQDLPTDLQGDGVS